MNQVKKMYAQVIHDFGSAHEVFKCEEVAVPSVGKQELLLEVLASSVNPVDCKIRSGLYAGMNPELPAILHSDVVGKVIEIGSQVQKFKIGDVVYGCAGGFHGTQGAIAEYMVVDEALVALKPKNLNDAMSASLPLVGLTAWLALFDRAQIRADQKVLIHAASGGVGSIALQLALWKGAKTFVTASSEEKGAFASSCGATVINYKTSSVDDYVEQYTDGKGFDVVFDTVGGDNLMTSIQALHNNGVVCGISACPSIDLRPLLRKNASLHYVFMPTTIMDFTALAERAHYGKILSQLAQLVEEKKLKPLVGAIRPFSELADAHVLQEKQEVMGKIALIQDLGNCFR